MKITLLLIGKTFKGWTKDALDQYEARIRHYVNFEIRELPDIKGAGSLTPRQVKEKEAAIILNAVKPNERLVLLDEHGAQFGSVQWAHSIEKMMSQGSDIVFAVGGAWGFAPSVHEKASSELSLSLMTFSHQLVRVVFAEQLYRAFTIIKGEPYHNE